MCKGVKGTMILTPTGEIPIENIKINDIVVLNNGKLSKIIDIGHEDFNAENPIDLYVIEQNALESNIPTRDTFLSPRHVFGYKGQLFHPEHLSLKGVKKCENMVDFTLYNIKMENYLDGLLIANGLEVEGKLDDVKVKNDNNLLWMTWDCYWKRDFGLKVSHDCKLLAGHSYRKFFKMESIKLSIDKDNIL